jgi:single-stranded DNA-binding protein
MATVQVIQRHAHLAGPVKLEYVKGAEGQLAKAMLTAISNNRRGSGDNREEESTAIQWTLWGRQAENAAQYLGKGSHVNVVGSVRNSSFMGASGEMVYALAFTCEEIDYLDSRLEAEARRGRQEFVAEMDAHAASSGQGTKPAPHAGRQSARA